MVYIPAGVFQMGDSFSEIGPDTLPLHNVYVSGFFMDKFEVSKELWQSVQTWGQANGYTNIYPGEYYANGHPVQRMSWYDAVKWCNACSEKSGLTPCYYTDNAQTIVYRNQGQTDITNAMVKWNANGYRLPTEAEWEKAARGGAMGLRYPWGNTVSGSQANYGGSGDPFSSNNPQTTPVGYYNGLQSPGGVDMANGYGLYDMAGNVQEWCWDWYGSSYYGDSTADSNPHGPPTGTNRVLRSGSWNYPASDVRCAYRRVNDGPGASYSFWGVRRVRGL